MVTCEKQIIVRLEGKISGTIKRVGTGCLYRAKSDRSGGGKIYDTLAECKASLV